MAPGSSSTLANSQCTLGGSGSSVSLSGTTLTLNLAITFNSSFGGAKSIYMQAYTYEGLNTGMLARGSWTVAPSAGGTPSAVSVSPSSGSGLTQTFTFAFSDTAGAADLHQQYALFSSSTSATNACEVEYDGTNLYLLNNAGATWLGPMAPGSSGSLSNSQCTLSGSGSSVSASGNTRTLILAMTFNNSFAGSDNIYMETTTQEGVNTGFVSRGTWTIPGTPMVRRRRFRRIRFAFLRQWHEPDLHLRLLRYWRCGRPPSAVRPLQYLTAQPVPACLSMTAPTCI